MEISLQSVEQYSKMRRREEKRREFHEALLQTLYPPSSPSPPSFSPSPVEVVDEKPFDVTLINPDDYVEIGSSVHGDVNEKRDESETADKPSRAQRKRLRKKMLKEEAARRKKIIGPLLPKDMFQTPNERSADTDGGNVEEDSSNSEDEASCLQRVRPNAQAKEEKFDANDKKRKVKKRREAKKLAKEKSKPIHVHNPTPEKSN